MISYVFLKENFKCLTSKRKLLQSIFSHVSAAIVLILFPGLFLILGQSLSGLPFKSPTVLSSSVGTQLRLVWKAALKHELCLHSNPVLATLFLSYWTSSLPFFFPPLHFNIGAFQEPILPIKHNHFFLLPLPIHSTTGTGCSSGLFPDLNLPFSVSTASPNNPAIHGDPGEPTLHCRVRPTYPGCVPAVLCPTGLRVLLFPCQDFLKISQNNLSYFLMVWMLAFL